MTEKKGEPLERPDALVLAFIANFEAFTDAQIANGLGLEEPPVRESLKRLMAHGLIHAKGSERGRTLFGWGPAESRGVAIVCRRDGRGCEVIER